MYTLHQLLFQAIKSKNKDQLSKILEQVKIVDQAQTELSKLGMNPTQARVDEANEQGWTAFYYACVEGDVEACKMLKEAGANPNRKTNLGYSSIWVAIENGNSALIEYLLTLQIDCNYSQVPQPDHSYDPEIERQKAVLIKQLESLKSQAEQLDRQISRISSSLFIPGILRFSLAKQLAQVEVQKAELLKKIAEPPKVKYFQPQTLLQFAINKNLASHYIAKIIEKGANADNIQLAFTIIDLDNPETLAVLINYQKQKRAAQFDINSLLIYAVEKNKKSCVDKMLALGANINAVIGTKTPLLLSIKFKLDDMATFLLERGADVEQSANGWKPLHYATKKNNVVVIALLLARNALIDSQLVRGSNILHYAVIAGNKAFVEEILKFVDINSEDSDGTTALLLAASQNIELTEFLLKKGANINHRNNNKSNALSFAGTKNKKILELLLSCDELNVRLEDPHGQTPLLYAVAIEHVQLTENLIERNSNLNHLTPDKINPLYIALYLRKSNILELLLSRGAEITLESDLINKIMRESKNISFLNGEIVLMHPRSQAIIDQRGGGYLCFSLSHSEARNYVSCLLVLGVDAAKVLATDEVIEALVDAKEREGYLKNKPTLHKLMTTINTPLSTTFKAARELNQLRQWLASNSYWHVQDIKNAHVLLNEIIKLDRKLFVGFIKTFYTRTDFNPFAALKLEAAVINAAQVQTVAPESFLMIAKNHFDRRLPDVLFWIDLFDKYYKSNSYPKELASERNCLLTVTYRNLMELKQVGVVIAPLKSNDDDDSDEEKSDSALITVEALQLSLKAFPNELKLANLKRQFLMMTISTLFCSENMKSLNKITQEVNASQLPMNFVKRFYSFVLNVYLFNFEIFAEKQNDNVETKSFFLGLLDKLIPTVAPWRLLAKEMIQLPLTSKNKMTFFNNIEEIFNETSETTEHMKDRFGLVEKPKFRPRTIEY